MLVLVAFNGLNMNVLAVRPPDDTTLITSCFDLNDNTVPEGWYLDLVPWRGGPNNFNNGALWGKPTDTGIALCKSLDKIQNVQRLEFEWDGSLNSTTWGMHHGVNLITKDGKQYRFLHLTAQYNIPGNNALVIMTPERDSVPPYAQPGDPNYAYITTYPVEYGSFHHQLIIQEGVIIFRATRLSDGSLVAQTEQPISDFQLNNIATVQFNVYATTDNMNWMDNLCFSYSQNDTTIWPSTTVPEVVDDGPDSPVELGVKFRSDVAGTITGIRFYKASANTGAHVGNLWTSNGTLLATATFINETASGWQQVLFATPVAIDPHTVYVASYHANNGHYSCDVNYFTGKGMDHPPLHALANGVWGGNGVYAYGANSVFPHQTWNTANYYVDVMFQAASPSVIREEEMFRLTTSTHSETQNLTLVVQERFGPVTSVADWEEVKSAVAYDPAKLQQFYELVGLRDGDAAICTRSGQFFWDGGNRQYYLQRFDSAPYPAFLVHDRIGTLYLGSWYELDMHVLAKTEEEAPFLEYVTTHETHSETQYLADVVASYFGGDGKIADWSDIKSAVADDPSKLQEFYHTVGLQDWDAAICLRDGEYFYAGNRQYYLERFDAGPYPNFLVHDRVGSLYLGSWYGLNMNVLAVRPPDDKTLITRCFDLNDNTVPEGWYLDLVPWRGGPNNFNNGALWGKPTDTGIALCKSLDKIQNVQRLEFEWDGSLNSTYWGMHHGVNLIAKDGKQYRFLHLTAQYNIPGNNALVIMTPERDSVPPYAQPGDPNYAYITTYPVEYGSFHHQLIIQKGVIIFRATRLSDGSLVAQTEQPISNFQLNNIATVQFNVYATTGNMNWMDNLCFSYSQNDTTIWPSTTVPEVVDDGPDSPVELGVKFRSDVAGTITGIRFYKASANTGAHVGNLWTSNGTLLATATFINETASGWQQVLFATPVAIDPHTVYVASYHANNGHYSCDVNYFTGKGMDHPPLHALANDVCGGNGVYAYGANSVFPHQTWNTANYYVDVMFVFLR